MEPARLQFLVLEGMRFPDSFRQAIDIAEELEPVRWALILDRHRGAPLNLDIQELKPWRWPTADGAVMLVLPEAHAAVQRWLQVEFTDVEWRARHVTVQVESLADFLQAIDSIPSNDKVRPRLLDYGEVWLDNRLPRSRWNFGNGSTIVRERVAAKLQQLAQRAAVRGLELPRWMW